MLYKIQSIKSIGPLFQAKKTSIGGAFFVNNYLSYVSWNWIDRMSSNLTKLHLIEI